MIIKERKLFFTRNGEYTVWEMLNELNEPQLHELYIFVLSEKRWTENHPGTLDRYPWFLYNIWDKLGPNERLELEAEIRKKFSELGELSSDFNGFLYCFSASSLDLESARLNLINLTRSTSNFEIDGLEISFFIYPELLESKNIVDVRFTSERTRYYLENENTIHLNTEIRVYLDLRIAVLTNYSEYTHSTSEKSLFIKEVLEAVSSH